MKKLSLLLLGSTLSLAALAQRTYVQCGKMVDVTNSKVRTSVTVIIDGNMISDVKDGYVNGSARDKVIDLRSSTVLPGLIDCHVHLESQFSKSTLTEQFTLNDADVAFHAAVYAKRTLLAGFTAVRDLGGTGVNIALRKAVNAGLTDGPFILTAGNAISATGGHMDGSVGIIDNFYPTPPGPEQGVANGHDELVKAVRYQFKKGADVIKIASTGGVLDLSKDGTGAQFTVDEIKAVVETANDYGMPVACHAHGKEGIKRAILGGVTSIEHGSFMDEECFALAKEHGTWLVPTVIAGRSTADSAKIPGFFPPVIIKKIEQVSSQIQTTAGKAYKAGVKMAFGTDAGVYAHGKNAIEFQYLVEAGIPPMEAIRMATVNAATLLGIYDLRGSITPGKLADLIAVPSDPTQDVKVLTNVTFVMKEGKIYKQ